MLAYPHINPIALQIGQFKVHWYGIMYIVGIAAAWLLARYRVIAQCSSVPSSSFGMNSASSKLFTVSEVGDLIFYCALGVIIGGRLGFIVFYYLLYNPLSMFNDPSIIFKVWEGGMSFHGGLIGVVVGLSLFAKKNHKRFIDIADFTAPLVPLGLFFGRIGNFINGELPGRVTNVAWGMIFPNFGALPRHPSQLYEAIGEGILLFIFMWCYSAAPKPRGKVAAWFLVGYGCIRFICELFREPDSFIGFIGYDWLTMGQLLSLPMVFVGAVMLLFVHFKEV